RSPWVRTAIRSIVKLDIEEERVDVARHHVLDEVLAERRVFRRAVELQRFSRGEGELVMIEGQVLTIDCEAQILIVLIADTHHPALEVKRVFVNFSVGQRPLKQSKNRQRRGRNVIMTEEVEAQQVGAAVVQQGLRQRSGIGKAGGPQAGRRLG